jgi:aspartyl-tRNA(Asn)/glutamyl-tRNA(Gln) amidotransferase subunit B
MGYFSNPKEVANWIIVELLSISKGDNKGDDDVKIDCKKFAKLIELVDTQVINRNVGKKLLSLVLTEDIDPSVYVEENKLGMISDTETIDKVIQEVLLDNTKSVDEYRNGNQKVLGFLIGQIMRKLGGKANPQLINIQLKKHLS